MAKSFGSIKHYLPFYYCRVSQTQSGLHYILSPFTCRQLVADNDIKSPEESPIQKLRIVGCANNNAVGIILLQKKKERVQHAPNLADIVLHSPFGAKSIKLVEEVDCTGLSNSIKD